MHASNLLKAVLKPRSLSANSSKKTSLSDGAKAKRSSSPDNRLPSASLTAKKSLSASSSPVKMTCMCSPTNHPGSFRCRFHRAQAQAQAAAAALPSTPRSGSSSAVSVPNKHKDSAARDASILSEVNRTLPGRPRSMSRSPPGRTSRLNRMTLGRDMEENDVIVSLSDEARMRNLKISASTGSAFQRPAAPAIMVDLPREIPTIFCQSTSKKALDVFDRSMTRMYL